MPKITDLVAASSVASTDLFIVVSMASVPTTKKITAAAMSTIAPVQSVAGRTGAITLAAADVSGLATVATSGAYADLTGKPTIPSAYTLPAATTSALGGVIIGSGLGVSSGTVSANVLSVAGKTGTVTLSLSDIGGTSTILFSDASLATGSSAITNVVSLTQTQYNAISSPSASTLYVIR